MRAYEVLAQVGRAAEMDYLTMNLNALNLPVTELSRKFRLSSS